MEILKSQDNNYFYSSANSDLKLIYEEVDVNNGVNTNFFNANEKGLLCYNKIMKNNFTFLDSPLPSLTISLVLEI